MYTVAAILDFNSRVYWPGRVERATKGAGVRLKGEAP